MNSEIQSMRPDIYLETCSSFSSFLTNFMQFLFRLQIIRKENEIKCRRMPMHYADKLDLLLQIHFNFSECLLFILWKSE